MTAARPALQLLSALLLLALTAPAAAQTAASARVILSTTSVETSEDGTTATFTVRPASQPPGLFTVTIYSSDRDEATVRPKTLKFHGSTQNLPTWSLWNEPQTVTVTGQDDSSLDGNQPYTISVQTRWATAEISGTNLDNEHGLGLSKTSVRTDEGGTADTFTVRLNTRPSAEVTVGVSSSDLSEATVRPRSLRFTASNWDTPQTVTVTGVDDRSIDGSKAYTVRLDPSSTDRNYNDLATVRVPGRNVDNEAGLTVSRSSVSTSENRTERTFTVRLNTRPSAHVTVAVRSSDRSEARVWPMRSQTLTFTLGNWNREQTVTVIGQDDNKKDGDQPYTIVLDPSSAGDSTYDGLRSTTVSGTNADNDTCSESTPCVTLELERDWIAEDGNQPLSSRRTAIKGRLSHAAASTVAVTVSAVPWTNAAADDFTLLGTTLTFAKGATRSTGAVRITAVDDDVDSLVSQNDPRPGRRGALTAKLVRVSGKVSTGAGLDPVDQALEIREDDLAGLVLDPAPERAPRFPRNAPVPIYRSVTESGTGSTATFDVKLATQPTANVGVRVKSGDPGEGLVSKAGDAAPAQSTTLTFTRQNWDTAQTVTLTGAADDVADGDIGYLLRFDTTAPATDAYAAVRQRNVRVETRDVQVKPVLKLSRTSIDESGPDNSATVTATLPSPAASAVTITVSAEAVSPAVAGDFTLSAATLAIDVGETSSATADNAAHRQVAIAAVDNKIDAANKTVTVKAMASGEHAVDPSDVTLTIVDDDTAGLAVSKSSVSTGEDESADTFTVQLDTQPEAVVEVAISSSDVGEATVSPPNLRFGAAADSTDSSNPVYKWDAAQMVSVSGKDDDADDGDQPYTITLTASSAGDTNYDAVPAVTVSGSNTDDDAAPTVSLTLDDASIPENGGTAEVAAALSHPSIAATTVTVQEVSGAYTVESDAVITIAAGQTTDAETVTVTAVDNTRDEVDRVTTVTASASNPQGVNPSVTGVSLTLEDDDDAPTVSIDSPSVGEGDSGSADLDFTVLLSAASGKSVTVKYAVDATDAGTATSGTDYAALSSGTLTFAAGETSKTVTVSVAGDAMDEPDETVRVTLSDPANATLDESKTTGTGTITDDDDAPTVSIGNASVSEGDSGQADLTFTVGLSAASGKQVTVKYADAGTGTATAGADYDVVPAGTLTFAAGDTLKTITVKVAGDTTDEPDETVKLTLSEATNATIGTATGTGTITDDDDAPSLSIGNASVTEGNSGQADLTFTVSLSAASGKAVTVKYADAGTGTATSGTDYAALSSGTLMFDAGDASKTVTVSVTGDTADEPDETVKLTLSAPTNATLDTAKATGTGTITDDDDAPTVTLSLSRTAIDEADQDSSPTVNTHISVVAASLNHASAEQITVAVAATAGTNAGSGDFSLSQNKTLTFAAGATSSAGTVTVTAVDNTRDEADKSVTVSGTTSGGVSGSVSDDPSSVTLTIRDDDGEPMVSIDSPSVSEGDSGSADLDFVVSLSAASGKPVTVKYAVDTADGGTATAGTDYAVLPAGTLTFAAGETSKTITVSVTGDTRDEPDETVKLTLSGPVNATLDASKTTGTGTITDDDDAPTVSISSPSVSEGDSGSADLDFVVSLSAASGKSVTVKYADAGTGTATAGTDYAVLPAGTLTFAAGETSKTITVSVAGDTRDEPDETVKLTLSGPVNATLDASKTTGTGTITDDDDAPTVSISSPSVSEGDSGSADLDFVVSLSAASGKSVTVKYADAGTGTAASGTDYAAVSETTLTFAAGDTSKTITVSVTGDTRDEPDETVKLTLSGPVNATLDASKTTGTGTITDDDDVPTVSISSPSVSEGDSGSADLDFTVSLSAASGKSVSVKYADAGTGTAASGTDYAAVSSGTLTFAAGDTSKTVTVSVTGDTRDEPDETVKLTLSGPTNAMLDASKTTGTGTITDDDDAPTVSISSPSVTEGDSGQTDLTFTVSLSAASGKSVSVKYADAGTGTATAGTDYAAVSETTLTFAAGDTSKTITVSVTGDTRDEPDETVKLTLSSPSNVTIGTVTGTGTITDDDGAPSLSISSPSVTEGDSGQAELTFTVSLSAASGKSVTVKYADAGTGTATSGTDYAAVSSGMLTFAAGDTSKTVRVSVSGDVKDEPDETVKLTLSSPSNATIGTATGTGTITDDDGAPSLSISSPSVTEGDSGQAELTFTVSLSLASGKSVTVKYADAGTGTATSGTDYAAVSSGTLTFAAGESSKTITVPVAGDTRDEPDETVKLTLSSPSNATIGTATGTGTITDDDGAPSLSISSPSVTEGDSGQAELTFTVSLSLASGKSVTVKYADAGTGTATSGTDYAAVSSGTLTFAAGESSKTITVPVAGDTRDEPDETVKLTLSEAANATIGTATGTGTITDDDAVPTVSISSPSVSEGDSGSKNLDFTVSLSAASGKQVTVDYAVDGADAGTATSGTDYEALAGGTLTFAAGDTSKMVRVSVTGDLRDEPDETVRVTLSGPANATLDASKTTGTGTITDDDAAPTVSIDSPSVSEGDSGSKNLDFTVSLSAASGKQVTVDYAVDGADAGTATSGTDYEALAGGTLTFAAGDTSKMVRVSVIGDLRDEPDETVRVTLSGPANATLDASKTTGTGTITDDDAAPTVSIDSPSVSEGDSGSADLDFTVSLSAASGKQVTVKYAVDGADAGTATSGTDYEALPSGTLTFAAGDTSKTITVSVTGDARDEPDETVRVTLSGPSNAALHAVKTTGSGTITDDDAAPTVTLKLTPAAIDESDLDAGTADSSVSRVSASLSHASSEQITVTVSAAAGAGASSSDFSLSSNKTLTFAAGTTMSTGTVTVSATDNAEDEANKSVSVSGMVTGGVPSSASAAPPAVTLTIRDDDGAPSVSINSPSVSEGDSGSADLDFTVSLSAASGQQVTVEYAVDGTDGGTATAGTDYAALPSGTLTFAAGETSKTITVSATGDAMDEPDETVRVTLSSPSNAQLGTSTGTGTITDDDDAPTVSLSLDDASIPENGGTAAVSATLSHASSRATTVTVSASPESYTVEADAVIVIAAGLTTDAETVTITAVDNALDEVDRTATVSAMARNGQGVGTVTGVSLTLEDDDAAPSVSIDSPSVPEGDSGSAGLEFTVTLSAASGRTVTVKYADAGTGTATAGADYTALTSGTLTFAAGTTSQTITVSVAGDALDEADETVNLKLSDATNAAIGTAAGTGTITDDDDAPSLSIGNASVTEGDSGQADLTFTVSLSAASGKSVTVKYADAGTGTATAGTDYAALGSGTLTFAAGDTSKTVTVSVTGDTRDEADETVNLKLSDATNAAIGTAAGTGTITDDDDAPSLSIGNASVTEGNSGSASLEFTVSLSAASGKSVTVKYADAGTGTATSGTDYAALPSGTLTFAAGDTSKTVTVSVTGDTRDEADETVRVTLSSPSNAALNAVKTTGVGTITDDDDAPTVSIDNASVTEGNSGSVSLEFTVSLSAASGKSVTVKYADAGTGTATAGADYAALPSGTLTFAAGDTSKAVTVSVTGDTRDEADETVRVTLSSPSNATLNAVKTTGVGTITDDDDAPTVSIDSPSVAEGDNGSKNLGFTVTLSAASGKQVTVKYADAGTGTATAGADYAVLPSGTLTFAAGDTSKTITVSVTGDTRDEADETVRLTLSGPTNATLNASKTTGVGTITDDDGMPSLSIGNASVTEGNSGQADLTFTVSLSAASGQAVAVKYADAGTGTATAGTDYDAVSAGTLTFAAGDTSKTITVKVTGDALDEPDETVKLKLSDATNAAIGTATGTGTITDDDDAPTVSISSPSVSEGDSGSADLDFVVSLSAASGKSVTVKYADAGTGTATAGTDYAALASGTLTFAAGDTSKMITVSVTGDTRDEADETVKLTLSGPTNATLDASKTTGTGTVTDDDNAPTVSIGNASVTEGNSGSASLEFTVSLSAASGKSVTVKYADAGTGTATAGTDYAALGSGTLTFAAGDTSKTITVSVTGDTRDEADETVKLTLSDAANATIGTATGTGTITDDDGVPSLSIGNASVGEGNSGQADLTFTVRLSGASGKQVTVKYADAGTGTATSGTDYDAVSAGTLTFAAGDTSKTITVSVTGDTRDEADETVKLTLSGPTNATLDASKTTGTGTITDDDDAPTVSISSPSVSEGDSGSADLDFVVSLSAASGKSVTVKYADAGTGTATAGTDYAAVSETTLTFAAGDTSKTITVSVTGDALNEADETVKLTLSDAANATIGTATGTGTITDDDGVPSLSISNANVAEGDSGQADLTFTVSLSAASGKQVTVKYADAGTGTATSGTDYDAVSAGTLTFAAGDTSKTITVSVTGDALDEPDETVKLKLSDATNAAIGTATGTGTITDDDGAPSLSILSPSVSEGDSGSADLDFVVSLSAASGKQVTVKYADAGTGTAASGTDYTALSPGTLTFAAGDTSKTITVSVIGDTRDEADETVKLTLSEAANATIGTAAGTGTITDDDGAPSLSISSPSVTEGDSGSKNLDFTVTLSAASGRTVTVKYADAGTGTATAGTDYAALGSGTLTFAAGDTSKTITVSVTGDTRDEPDETVKLTLSDAANATIGTAAGTGTITDDDGAPSLSIGNASVSEGNSGSASLEFTVSLSPASGQQVTVKYADAGTGTATAGTDYTALSSGTLTFAAGDTSKTITVSVTGDTRDEADETVKLTLSEAANATIATAAGTGTITDDDDAPTVSISSPSVPEGDSGSADLDFTVSLSAASGKQVTVKYTLDGADGGTATAGADYEAVSETTLTFAPGDTSKTVRVKATGDTRDEPDETVKLTLSDPTNAVLDAGKTTGTGTITDDDGAPSLSISSPSVAEGNSGSVSLEFTVSLSPASGKAVTVKYADAGTGTATAGTDYAALGSGTLTFAAGQTSKTITVSVAGDALDEADETVKLALSDAANAAIGTATGTGTITDDDGMPSVSIDSPSMPEGDSGSADLVFTVSLSTASGRQVTVEYADVGTGTATAGTDYDAVPPGTLTFAAGTTRQTITVSVTGDTLNEADETVKLTLSGPSNATLDAAKTTGTGTITDDDDAPGVPVASGARGGDGGSSTDHPPTVHAGEDAAVDEGVKVVLDGNASSDPESGALTYRWTQVGAWLASAAPADLSREADRTADRIPARFRMTLTGADTARPHFTPRPRPELLENLVLVFRLTVTDPSGQSNVSSPGLGLDSARDPGLVAITVRSGPDDPPVAVARAAEMSGSLTRSVGGDMRKALTVGEGAKVMLSGAGSRDPEGEALSYSWTQTGLRGAGSAGSGTAAVTLSDAAAESLTFTAPAQLAADLMLEFTLAVNERGDRDAPATDVVTVTVRAGPNDAPTAVARAVAEDGELVETLEVGEGEAVTLDGSGSSDPEGEALSYVWTQKSGPAVDDLRGGDTARPTFTAPRSAQDASAVFGLVVTDARGLRSAEDTVAVVVRAHTGERLTQVTEVLLPRTVQALADIQTAAVWQRLDRAGQGGPSRSPALTELLERQGAAAADGAPEWKPLLPEASFEMPLAAAGDAGGGLVLWGGGDYRRLDGDSDGVRWDGEVVSAHLGADRRLPNGLLAGLSVSWSEAEFDYAAAADGMGGDWKMQLTGVQPYLGWTTDGGLDLWAAVGYGRGDLDVRDQAMEGEAQRADAHTRMTAAGVRGLLHEAAGLRLSARGEALYSRLEIDGNGGLIAGQTADSTRLRLALDVEGETDAGAGARLLPRFELGLRHDGGDGSSGLGVEVGGGLGYAAEGLQLSGEARVLLANSDYDEWGVSMEALYAPAADGRGLSLSLLPSWGEAESGTNRLWEQGAPNLEGEARAPEPRARLEAELGYGLASPFGRGLLKWTAGAALAEDDGIGGRLAGGVELGEASFGLEVEVRYPETGAAERRVMARGELRF